MMQSHFQGPLLGCFEYVPYTALLLFRQSMSVLIAIGSMYLILLQGKIHTNENQSNEMLGLCFVLK